MQRTDKDQKIKKAEQFCKVISDQQNSFAIHGFHYNDYTDEDRTRIRLINKFFGLKTHFDCMVLCFFIEKRLEGERDIRWRHIIEHFSLTLEDCVRMNVTIQRLIKLQLIQPTDRYHGRENEFCLTKNCFNNILNYRPVTSVKPNKNDFIDGFMKEYDALISDTDESTSDLLLENFESLLQDYQSLPEIQWLKRYKISPESMVIFFMVLRNHIFYRTSLNLEKIFDLVENEAFKKYELEKELKGGHHELIKNSLLCFEKMFFITDNLQLTTIIAPNLC